MELKPREGLQLGTMQTYASGGHLPSINAPLRSDAAPRGRKPLFEAMTASTFPGHVNIPAIAPTDGGQPSRRAYVNRIVMRSTV
jgi:hypothetical protein